MKKCNLKTEQQTSKCCLFVLLKNSLPIKWENARQGYTEHDQNAIGLWGVGEGTRAITLATYATGFLGLWLPVCLVQLSGSRGLPNGVLVMGAATGGQTGPRGCLQHLRASCGLSQTLQM